MNRTMARIILSLYPCVCKADMRYWSTWRLISAFEACLIRIGIADAGNLPINTLPKYMSIEQCLESAQVRAVLCKKVIRRIEHTSVSYTHLTLPTTIPSW